MPKQQKSWGREIGLLMLLHLGYLSIWGDVEAMKLLVWPYMSFTFWAYGIVKNVESLNTLITSYRR